MKKLPDGYIEHKQRVSKISLAILEALPSNQLYDELFEALLHVAVETLNSQQRAGWKDQEDEENWKQERMLVRAFLLIPEIWAHPETVELWDKLGFDVEEGGNGEQTDGW